MRIFFHVTKYPVLVTESLDEMKAQASKMEHDQASNVDYRYKTVLMIDDADTQL